MSRFLRLAESDAVLRQPFISPMQGAAPVSDVSGCAAWIEMCVGGGVALAAGRWREFLAVACWVRERCRRSVRCCYGDPPAARSSLSHLMQTQPTRADVGPPPQAGRPPHLCPLGQQHAAAAPRGRRPAPAAYAAAAAPAAGASDG